MADQYEHARSHSAESYESGPSSQASTVPGPAYNGYGKERYDNEYSQVELVSHGCTSPFKPLPMTASKHKQLFNEGVCPNAIPSCTGRSSVLVH